MNDIRDIQQVRQYLQGRLQRNPKLRVNVELSQPKIHMQDVTVTLTGVYAHIFEVEEATSGTKKRHTLQYADVLLRHIQILD